jgi:hypothetical protein
MSVSESRPDRTTGRDPILGQVTGPPYITLVDIHGCPVGVGEKDIPEVDREPCPADSWPAWTDVIRVRCGRRDFDGHALQVLLADAIDELLDRVDAAGDFDEAMDAADAAMPLPDPARESDRRSPEEWQAIEPGPSPDGDDLDPPAFGELTAGMRAVMGGPEPPDAPDAGEHCRFPGNATLAERRALPPVAGGGAPEPEETTFEPSDADWAALREWAEEVARRRDEDSCKYGYE